MAIYLARTCPKCRHYWDIAIPRVRASETVRAINAVCLCCQYQLNWQLIPGGLYQTSTQRPLRQRFYGSTGRIEQRMTLSLIKLRG